MGDAVKVYHLTELFSVQGVIRTTETDLLEESIDQVAAIVYEATDQDGVAPQPCSAYGFGTSLYERTVDELRVRSTSGSPYL